MRHPSPYNEGSFMSRSRMGMRFGAATLLFASVMAATAAVAHVTVNSPDAEAGGFGKIVFRVPTESPTASTNEITIDLPEDAPFAVVTAKVKPGWDVDIDKETLDAPVQAGDFDVTEVVRSVTWSSETGIGPDEFDEFELSVGPFPETGELTFAAIQRYDDGSEVAWDDVATGHDEGAKPAPVLELAGNSTAVETASTEGAAEPDVVARSLGGGAIVLAAGAVVVAARKNGSRA